MLCALKREVRIAEFRLSQTRRSMDGLRIYCVFGPFGESSGWTKRSGVYIEQ
jgi:hypothetical protein